MNIQFVTENLSLTQQPELAQESNPAPQPNPVQQPSEVNSPLPRCPREGETVRHILLGRPAAVRQTIYLLHQLRYAETLLWSPVVAIPQNQLILRPQDGEVMSLLVRHL